MEDQTLGGVDEARGRAQLATICPAQAIPRYRPDYNAQCFAHELDNSPIQSRYSCTHTTIALVATTDAATAIVGMAKTFVKACQVPNKFGKFHTYISHETGGLLRSADVGNQLGECLLASRVGCI